MPHIHVVQDADKHFIIDPCTGELVNYTPEKRNVRQFAHNSERLTFELPRFIEGHDMSTCNAVEVHFINVDAVTGAKNPGLYPVKDLALAANNDGEETVKCSWLISREATQLAGPLLFRLNFICSTDGNVDYLWPTAIYRDFSVADGISNTECVVDAYPDVLADFNDRLRALEASSGSSVDVDQTDVFGGYDRFYDSIARLKVNPAAPLDIDTYDGSGQLTHPCVRYFPDGWCGHKYWMVGTPYPNSALDLENPCVWYSDDGYNWSAEGIPNPLDLPLMVGGEQASMNSDPHLLVRPDGVMEVWWRTNYWENSGEGLYTVVYRRTSTNGISWTTKEELYRALTGSSDGIVCPVALYEDGVYKIWAVSDQECLRYYESATGSDWRHIRDIDVSNPDYPEYKVWHFDVNHTAKGYEFVGNYNIPGDYTTHKYIYYAVSQDNITYTKRVMILARGAAGNFDERLLYRPTIIRLPDRVMVFYGANDADNAWHIGQIEAPSAYLFNAVLIAGERIKAIESKNAQQDGRLGALESGGGTAAAGQTIVESFDVSPWVEGYWKPEANGEMVLYGNFHHTQLIPLANLMDGGEFPNITAISSVTAYPVLRVNYFNGNLEWIGFDAGTADPTQSGKQPPTPVNWPAGAVYFAISANSVDKSAITVTTA